MAGIQETIPAHVISLGVTRSVSYFMVHESRNLDADHKGTLVPLTLMGRASEISNGSAISRFSGCCGKGPHT